MSARYGGPQVPGGGTPAGAALTTLITATGNGTFDLAPAVAAGHKTARLQLLAGGTGAGSGRRGAAGTVRCAGGPGANGAFVDVMVTVADVLAAFPTGLVPYNVGPGTAGGAAVTVDDTNGNAGAVSGTLVNGTWFGAAAFAAGCIAHARPGSAGSGGTNASGAAGTPVNGTTPTPGSPSASATGLAGPAAAGVPGAGGGITTADAPGAGGVGGTALFWGGVGGTGGVVGGATPGSGTLGPLVGPGAPPGGGAASITGPAQAGANALPNSGAGGGSGGASLNGFASGKGGDGGSGFMRITTSG